MLARPPRVRASIGSACSRTRAAWPGASTSAILSLQDGGTLPELLDAAANIIDKRWAGLNPPLLVHCGAGVERSLLTVAVDAPAFRFRFRSRLCLAAIAPTVRRGPPIVYPRRKRLGRLVA
jgi:hypothetical protein